MKKDIRNHPYHFEQALQATSSIDTFTNGLLTLTEQQKHQQQQQQQVKSTGTTYFTWLVFMYAKWVPFDANNQGKLEQTLHLGGTFVDIEDSNFPKVKRVRVFPKSNYLSYLGVKYRLSRVMQPDAWSDSQVTPPSEHNLARILPPPIDNDTTRINDWQSSPPQSLISHVLS